MLAQLEIRDFRNLAPTTLDLGAGRHLILGHNGAGKTSLIEAAYVIATTRSFRTPRLADAARHGGSGFVLRGESIAAPGGVPTRLDLVLEGRDRRRRVNGETVSLAEHLAVQPVIAWTAADLDVLIGPPEARRRFLDRGIVGLRPTAIEAISRYRGALDAKRGWLRSGSQDRDQLDVWNHLLADAAVELVARRAAYAERLSAELSTVLADAELGIPEVELLYRPSPVESLDDVGAAYAAFAAVADKEQVLEQPLLGPQRDDLIIRWDGHGIRRVASAGERKALGLALLVAHGRVLRTDEVEPTVLLDDVDVELDPGRLERLWALLGDHRQVLVTSARPAVWQALDIDHRLNVEAGCISSA